MYKNHENLCDHPPRSYDVEPLAAAASGSAEPGPKSAGLLEVLRTLGFDETPIFRSDLESLGSWVADCDGRVFLDVTGHAGPIPDARRRAFDEGDLDDALASGRASSEPDDTSGDAPVRHALKAGMESLCARFPSLVVGFEMDGAHAVAHLSVTSAQHATELVSQSRAMGLRSTAEDVVLSLRFDRLARPQTVAFAIGAMRRSLKHMEAGRVAVIEHRPQPTKASQVRTVSAADADNLVPKFLALEAEIFEPARRDLPEKLRKPIEDPDGVAVIAEVMRDGEYVICGFSLASPLEEIDADGPLQDVFRGAHNTLYAVSTTLGPAARGLGLGLALKREVVAEARRRHNPDGSPRYQFVSGRNRVGSTDAMQRINARLGAYEVSRHEGQYDGTGSALYYRMPVGPVRRRPALPETSRAYGGLERPLRHPGEPWLDALGSGELSGAALRRHPLADAMTPQTACALKRLAGLVPLLPRVAVFGSEGRAFAHIGAAVAVGDAIPFDGPRVPRWQDAAPDSLLLMEPIDRKTGQLGDVHAPIDAGRRVAWVETTSAYGRGGKWPLLASAEMTPPEFVVWATGSDAVIVHGRTETRSKLGDASEFALLWCVAQLERCQQVEFDAPRLKRALHGVGATGQHGYYVLPPIFREALTSAGWVEPGSGSNVLAPPLDVDEEDFDRLEAALRAIVRT